jgi:hypothetical protein
MALADGIAKEKKTERALPAGLSFLDPVVVDDLRRYGHTSDGGYVLPASGVARCDAVISFGLSDNWTLEEELLRLRPGITIHAYDHTVGKRFFRRRVIRELEKLLQFKSTVAKLNDKIRAYRSYNAVFSGNRRQFEQRVYNRIDAPHDVTIDQVFTRLAGKTHIFLKMDIEGGEYRVIPQILEYADRIDLMTIEFHDTDPLRDIFVKQVKTILGSFEIVHIHANNAGGVAADGLPELLEITFLNRKFVTARQRRGRLPLAGLDFPNDPAKPELPLIFG